MKPYTDADMQWARDFRARESELRRNSAAPQSGGSEGDFGRALRRKQARQLCECCAAVCRYGESFCLGCKALHGDKPAPSAGVGTGMVLCARRDEYLAQLHGSPTSKPITVSREALAAVAALEA